MSFYTQIATNIGKSPLDGYDVKYDINGDGLLTVLDVSAIPRKLIPDSKNKAQ